MRPDHPPWCQHCDEPAPPAPAPAVEVHATCPGCGSALHVLTGAVPTATEGSLVLACDGGHEMQLLVRLLGLRADARRAAAVGCGTAEGWEEHMGRGEEPCGLCVEAHRRRLRSRLRNQVRAAS